MMYFSVIIAVVLLYFLQSRIYRKKTTKGLSYEIKVGKPEVRAGEAVDIYEALANQKLLPLPFIKVNTELPEGLYFQFRDGENGGQREQHVQSIYVLQSYQQVTRHFRITGERRGNYRIGNSKLLTNDLFGLNPTAIQAEALESFSGCDLLVLPRLYDLDRDFILSRGIGSSPDPASRMTDPMQFAGIRDYRPDDPMKRINWKASAAHSGYMVNIEEPTSPKGFNIILNTQSRPIEQDPEKPSDPKSIDDCISTAVTLLYHAMDEHIPIRLISNTLQSEKKPKEGYEAAGWHPLSEDETGKKLTACDTCRTRTDVLRTERLLAVLPEIISVPEQVFLDHIMENPYLYTASEQYPGRVNLIMISSYFSERMLRFHRYMESQGVAVTYYIMSRTRSMDDIPEEIRIHYLASFHEKGR
ncbi:MAG: DUF58 domain-containing protein [Clostridia bacterium]|nr:DUF58 domain-containing protein [Clostridia bacterium]